jgi:SNF2 family DNA or RNA helicase
MAEPPGSLPGSPKIKTEPQETSSVAPTSNTAEKPEIVEISDDEELIQATRPLGSPFLEQPQQEEPKTTEAINLGASLLVSKPKPAKSDLQEILRAQFQEARRNTAQQFQQKPAQRTPDPVGRSEMFVTNSHLRTPDAAEVFRALQRNVESKRSRGILGDIEEIEFMRAETEEKIRLFRERAETNQDALDGETSTTRPPRSFAVPELGGEESSDGQQEPKKRGRKRKADTDAKPQPNKRRQPNNSTEDILVVARRKLEAKAKAKATKGKRATKNDQNSKGGAATNKKSQKYKGPSMLNRNDLFGGTDFVEDAARNEHLANPPTVDPSTKRSTAFKQLLASVPDSNRKIAKIDKKYFEDQLKYFTGKGHSVKPAADGNWEVKGMKVSLKPYQILGVSFLRSRENATEEPRGSILADQMGLGKTIQMLANIVNARPLLKTDCRTTLIVASAALVSQWRQEIANKVYTRRENKHHGIGRVMEYHANSQALGNEQIEMLLECDIVLTTYTQVSKSYPKAEPPAKFVTAEQKLEWWKTYYEKNKGILHRIRWVS